MNKINKILFYNIFTLLLFFALTINTNALVELDCNNTLRKGDTGSNVITLQKHLNKIMDCDLEVDGIFGSKTNACVTQFQEEYGLTVDGVVAEKETCPLLNEINEDRNTYVVVTTRELNVREEPELDSEILTTIKLGKVVKIRSTIIRNNKTWYKVKVKGNLGYISSEYAKKTSVLLNIDKQNLKFYEDGKLVIDTNVVTGKLDKHDTPIGHYILEESNKETDRILKGKNDDGSKYAAHVDYWMPFITSRGIGFHDASWRNISEFNVDTYKSNGSHGCVNMLHEDAELLYSKINDSIDVVVK